MPNNIIKPPILAVDRSNFFMGHINRDLLDIGGNLAKSRDDVLLLLHQIIHNFIGINIRSDARLSKYTWNSKDGRSKWEKHFVGEYISPSLIDIDEKINNLQQLILNDTRQENNRLLKKIYEIDDEAQPSLKSLNQIQDCSLLWKFRTRISADNITLNLDNLKPLPGEQRHYTFLQRFLKQQQYIDPIRYLSRIQKLHQKLIYKLYRTLDYSKANIITISQFLDSLEEFEKNDLQPLFEDFLAAWNISKHHISDSFQGKKLPENYQHDNLSMDSRIAVALPFWKGYGFYSLALVNFLVLQQNNLLDIYCKEEKKSIEKQVDLCDATSAHIITCDPKKDILNLILANCNYTYEIGSTTKIDFDYANLEKQIISRFIAGKPRLKSSVICITFKENFKTIKALTELESKTAQVPLPHDAFKSELKSLASTSEALASLNIAIEFLTSLNTDPDTKIIHFMDEVLKIKSDLLPKISVLNYRIKHVKAVWLNISLIRAKLQADIDENPFDYMDSKYQTNLPEHLKAGLKQCLSDMDIELFVQELFECIVFALIRPTNGDFVPEDIDNSDQKLKDAFFAYLETQDKENYFPTLMEDQFPSEILVCHCISTWLFAVKADKNRSG